ncbi:MAG: Fic family protein [Flavobacteriales bacterium]|nr:Fic family protein [Flavobacteriales bacterium]MCB0786163.1 Fic family protein [Flavobacteriales bacterium]MCB0807842.1 Fic family protein [Flavobacteriales bacterium]MCB0814789.1 Fic family protein [Flavobacteriales bacterium]
MLSDTLALVDSLKAEFESLRPLKPEHEQRLWQKLRLEWNYNSNHIEGNTLTYGETFLLLVHGQTNGGHTMREFEEMKAHDVAVAMVKEWSQDNDRSISESDVRSLNEVLLKEPFWKEAITADGQPTRIEVIPGKYKKTGNVVRQPDGSLFHYASPEEVPGMMQDLMSWYNEPSDLHPVQKAAILHHRFIVIHPFGDGNGRTARLLVNYHLMRHGLMPLVVKSADKSNYLRCLKLADAGDMTPFAEYLAEAEVWALELAIKAGKGESVEEPSDVDKEIALFKLRNKETEGPRLERSEEILSKTYRLSLRPLFQRFIDAMIPFEEFFKTTRYHVKVGHPHGTVYERTSCIRAMDNAFNELEFRARRAKAESVLLAGRPDQFKDLTLDSLDELSMTVSFDDYLRAGTNIFNAHGNMKVSFSLYKYSVEVPGRPDTRKEWLYHQPLTPTDVEHYVTVAKRQTWDGIKAHLEQR